VFDFGPVVNALVEYFEHAASVAAISVKAVCGELEPLICEPGLEAAQKIKRVIFVALANQPMNYQFAYAVNSQKDVLIAPQIIINGGVLLQAIYERIDFVNLNLFDFQVS